MTDRKTIRVCVASQNPVKRRAVRQAFERAYPDADVKLDAARADSGVSDQPMTDEETLTGARNRARAVHAGFPDHAFHVGIEGGIERRGDELEAFAWVVVLHEGAEGRSRSCSFQLPDEVARMVLAGTELGKANDHLFGTTDSKHDQGAVGILTGGLIDRAALYEPAVVLALVPFLRR